MNSNCIRYFRNLLSELCPESDDIRRVCSDANFDIARVNLSSSAQNIWHSVLIDLRNNGRGIDLAKVVQDEYGRNEKVQDFIKTCFPKLIEPRCPCILLLDVSGSMNGAPITELNRGLSTFEKELKADDLATRRVEAAICSFGNSVNVEQNFVPAHQLTVKPLQARGNTPMGQAIRQALEMLRLRLVFYDNRGVPHYRPWVFLITNGEPTDEWQTAAQSIKQAKDVVFFAVGLQNANMNTLVQITDRHPLRLNELNFRDMFVWLSQSLIAVSHSQVGSPVPLQPPSGWWLIE